MTPAISPHTLKAWLHDGEELALFDVREAGPFTDAHLLHAIPLPYSGLELHIGRLAPRRSVRTVVCDADGVSVAPRAAARLRELGYQNVHLLAGGTQAWQVAGYTLFAGVNVPSKVFGELVEEAYHTPHITPRELAAWFEQGKPVVLLDGRPLSEFHKMSIPHAECCPNGELAYRIADLVPDAHTPVVINCAGRTRSILGAQTLINLGLTNPVHALQNGTQGWHLEDRALDHGRTSRLAPATRAHTQRANAEQLARQHGVRTVDAATVRAWACDPARSLFLCDVRTQEEFEAGSLPGAGHAPGGQLIQATDQYIGVRRARIVLLDDDGVRAPVVASWLRQLGHDASVLAGGLRSGLHLEQAPPAPTLRDSLPRESAEGLARGLREDGVRMLDLRPSPSYRQGHIPSAQWSTRPLLAQAVHGETRHVVLVVDGTHTAASAAHELAGHAGRVSVLEGGMQAWLAQGRPVTTPSSRKPLPEHIDFVTFTYDRHDGNKDAARQYLAWEIGLVAQLDTQERAEFRLPTSTTT